MNVRIGARANRHLLEIAAYIRPRNAQASIRVGNRIRETLAVLGEFPLIGRKGKVRGTHELPVVGLPFVIVYRIEKKVPDTVAILGIYHCAQLRPVR